MITMLVHYKIWVDSGHPLLDGGYVKKSEIVEVERSTDINSLFKNIVDVKKL